MWFCSVYADVFLYALLTMSGHTPDELVNGVLDLLSEQDGGITELFCQMNKRAFQCHQCLCHPGTGKVMLSIVLHKEETRSHCNSIKSESHSEDFIVVLSSSQDTISTEILVILLVYVSVDHHRQIAHAECCNRQHNFTISRLFHTCHMCSVWT